MTHNHRMNLAGLFDEAAATDPARPLLTYYDDTTGERTELSYLTFHNWVAKTANLLVDGLGFGAGDTAGVALPAHWLTGPILMGCWRAGLAVRHEPGSVEVLVTAEDAKTDGWSPGEHCAVSLTPMAVGLRDPRARRAAADGELLDFLTEVRSHGDHFSPPTPVADTAPALTALPGGGAATQAGLVSAAHDRAAELGVQVGERLLMTAERSRPLDWLLVPLAVKGSVVLCRNSQGVDLDRRADTEHARRCQSVRIG